MGSIQLALGIDEPITVHCFTCPHVETGTTPEDAHDLMERHYRAKHHALIPRLAAS